MSDNDVWRAETDDIMTMLINQSNNSFWPAFAVAAALLDQGVLDKGRLLDIVEAIMGYVSADEAGSLTREDELLKNLAEFRGLLVHLRLQPGSVAEELQRLEKDAEDEAKPLRRGRTPESE